MHRVKSNQINVIYIAQNHNHIASMGFTICTVNNILCPSSEEKLHRLMEKKNLYNSYNSTTVITNSGWRDTPTTSFSSIFLVAGVRSPAASDIWLVAGKRGTVTFLKREECSIPFSIPRQEFKKQLIVLFLLEKSVNTCVIMILVINILTSSHVEGLLLETTQQQPHVDFLSSCFIVLAWGHVFFPFQNDQMCNCIIYIRDCIFLDVRYQYGDFWQALTESL